ncbi:hypothetical protein [Streptomyces sp. NRRL F-2580]|uniref:hypothetical protein n=1 Tax=Streptomyces sp. NRRL F-2580 TaxID=1463841 RepID=UPI0004C76124|nr:hypothetical protein [Streptomyces sp. NRRL F-2580]
MEKRLPDLNTLIRLSQQGLTDEQIGKRYEVSGQAVNKALTLGGYYRRQVSKTVITELIPWDVLTTKEKGSHHNTYLAKQLRAYLRAALGDDQLNETHLLAAARFEKKIRDKNLIVTYDRETAGGFGLEPRTDADGALIVRWPRDRELPEGDYLNAITLADE